jgi:threonine/homoserine/homoserine lactone efflux protein
MLGIHDLALFIVAGVALNLTPGPDMALVAARTAAHGARAGAAAALGVGAGCLVHTLAAALGLSAVIAASATAFTAVKWAGAAYLVWAGFVLLRSAWRDRSTAATVPRAPRRGAFVQGFLTNVLNPKVALFFLAFLPQFIDSSAPHKALAFVLLGLSFNVSSTLVNLATAWLTARAARRVSGSHAMRRWLEGALGAFFMLLAARLAASRAT